MDHANATPEVYPRRMYRVIKASPYLSLWIMLLCARNVTSLRPLLPHRLAQQSSHRQQVTLLYQSSRPASLKRTRRKRVRATTSMPTNNNDMGTTAAPRQRIRRGKSNSSNNNAFTTNSMLEHDILTKEQEVELGHAIQKLLQLQETLRVHIEDKKQELALRAQEQQQSEAEWFSLMGEGNSKPFHDLDDDDDYFDDLVGLSVMEPSAAWYQQQSSLSLMDNIMPDAIRSSKNSLEENSDSKFFLQDAELDLLSEEELQEYVGFSRAQVQRILLQGAVARDTMIRSNVKLVVGIAKKWALQQSRGLTMSAREIYRGSWNRPSLDEVIQEGISGLIQAVERFDPTRNVKFSTFATSYITNKVRICFQVTSTSLKIPPVFHIIRQNLQKRIREYHLAGEEVPSWEELAAEIGVTPSRLELAMRMTQSALSIDAPMYSGGSVFAGKADAEGSAMALADLLEDEELSEDRVELSFLRQTLESAMANELGPTERDILRLRLGLDDGVTKNCREVSEVFGGMLSQSQVRRYEKAALSKLRSPNSLATYKFLAYLDFAGIDSATAKLD